MELNIDELKKKNIFEAGKDINRYIYYNYHVKKTHSCGICVVEFYKILKKINIDYMLINLYNIQLQGNHSTIQVINNGDKVYFDPTFGIYFYNKKFYDIEDILNTKRSEIEKYCWYASYDGKTYTKNHDKNFLLKDTNTIIYSFNVFYINDFVHFLNKSPQDANFYMNIDLNYNNKYGIDSSGLDLIEAQKAFLSETNKIIIETGLKEKPRYGYLFMKNGYFNIVDNFYLNITSVITVNNIKKDKQYHIIIKGINNNTHSTLKIINNYGLNKLNEINEKYFEIKNEFISSETMIIFALENLSKNNLWIFSVEINTKN